MHLLIACALALAFAIFLDRSRVIAHGLLFMLRNYAAQIAGRVKFRRVIYAIAILLFVIAAWQALGFEWAFVAIGGDTILYLEIVSAIYLMAVRGHIRQIKCVGMRTVTGAIQKSITLLRGRSRARRIARRKSSNGDRGDDDAEPEILGAFAFS